MSTHHDAVRIQNIPTDWEAALLVFLMNSGLNKYRNCLMCSRAGEHR